MTDEMTPNSNRERYLFIGSGLVLAIAMLVGMAREQHWGTSWIPVHLLSSNADGLRSGQEVRISGIRVGKVQAVQLQSNAQVKVTLVLEAKHAGLVGPKSVVSLGQEGLVGDHYVVISADPQTNSTSTQLAQRILPYEQPVAINNLMHRLVDTQTELQATLQNTTRLTSRELPATLSSMHKLASALERETARTTPELRTTLQQLSRTGSSAERTSRQAQQLLEQSQPLLISTLQELERVASSSRRILQSLLGLSESLPKSSN